jgi:hypothetical protein
MAMLRHPASPALDLDQRQTHGRHRADRTGNLNAERLAARWPVLFHMAEAGSWPAIRRDGLLSTSALLDLYEVEAPERDAIESARRPQPVWIEHAAHGRALIRDNKPINETALRRTLVGMSESQWFRELNRRVFFWLSHERLDRLRRAQYNRGREHDILVIDTRALLESRAPQVELAHLNTGAVHRAANYPRGAGTFTSIEEYPWAARLRSAPREPIVELTVRHSVPDIADLVIEVVRC